MLTSRGLYFDYIDNTDVDDTSKLINDYGPTLYKSEEFAREFNYKKKR